ncbi:head scaffolding protein [Mycobacterium phage SWU2]|uniref:Capsid and scaffold protein n=1 Tax=Mycobacterium phage SWU2 TaxID=2077150 RepID=A0A2K9VHZ7_9CAUD|nr:head scaffolding protein [Mycobacterium phage SWU2]AUV61974.1 capsid and scaffold protein [Mycobacterium phage SWU2]
MADEVNPGATDTTTTQAEDQASKPEVFSREYVEGLRRENAAHRTSKQTAVDEAVAAVKQQYETQLADKDTAYAALQNELGNAWIELEKVYTAIEAKVPSDKVRALAEFLQGTDKESITESAKSAAKLFGGWDSIDPAVDPTQGKGGGTPLPLNGDPILQALKAKIGF